MPSLLELKTLILTEVGAGLEGDDRIDQIILDKVTPQFDVCWAKWAWKNYYPNLQYLYVKRELIEILQGQFRDLIDTKLGSELTVNQQMIFANLKNLHYQLETQLQVFEKQAQQSRGVAITEMRHRTPQQTPAWMPNPAAPVFRGDPLDGWYGYGYGTGYGGTG